MPVLLQMALQKAEGQADPGTDCHLLVLVVDRGVGVAERKAVTTLVEDVHLACNALSLIHI